MWSNGMPFSCASLGKHYNICLLKFKDPVPEIQEIEAGFDSVLHSLRKYVIDCGCPQAFHTTKLCVSAQLNQRIAQSASLTGTLCFKCAHFVLRSYLRLLLV